MPSTQLCFSPTYGLSLKEGDCAHDLPLLGAQVHEDGVHERLALFTRQEVLLILNVIVAHLQLRHF